VLAIHNTLLLLLTQNCQESSSDFTMNQKGKAGSCNCPSPSTLRLNLAPRADLTHDLGRFQVAQLFLGEDQMRLGGLGFQRLEPLAEGLQIMPQPDAAVCVG
jgi:hypothetical protein